MKFSEIAIVRVNFPEADFWLIRKGGIDKVGAPVRGFNREHIGVQVLQRDMLDSNYGFYLFEWIRDQGYWRQRSHGILELKHITVRMVKNLKVG